MAATPSVAVRSSAARRGYRAQEVRSIDRGMEALYLWSGSCLRSEPASSPVTERAAMPLSACYRKIVTILSDGFSGDHDSDYGSTRDPASALLGRPGLGRAPSCVGLVRSQV